MTLNLNCTFCKFKIVLLFWEDNQTRPRSILKRVQRWWVSRIRSIFVFASTVFGTRSKDNWPIKFRKLRDIIFLRVLGREPEGTQATTMATATKTSLKMCIRAASNLLALISSRSVRLETVSKFRKRKRKSLVLFSPSIKGHFHVEVVQWRSRNVQKKRDACAKLLLKLLLFWGHSEGFQVWYLELKNEYPRALKASYTFQALMSFWLSLLLFVILVAVAVAVAIAP